MNDDAPSKDAVKWFHYNSDLRKAGDDIIASLESMESLLIAQEGFELGRLISQWKYTVQRQLMGDTP